MASARNMKRQLDIPNGVSTDISQPDSGAPMTTDTGMAIMGSENVVARSRSVANWLR